jgi:hypothetical protein
LIPSTSVGGIIGKGGQMLKDLQTEFGLRVYVEKEMHGTNTGMRTVVLASQSPSGVYLLCFVCYSVQLFTFMLAFGELPPLYPVVCCCGRVLLWVYT